MKKTVKYGASALLALIAVFSTGKAAAAIDAKIGFETEIPKTFVCDPGSRTERSDRYYKDGTQSLRWSWDTPSALHYTDFGQLMRSVKVPRAGIMLWIYNPRAVDTAMRFSLLTPTGEIPYYFDFGLNYTGWRACWIKYEDMQGDHSSQQIARMRISTPEGVESGEIYIDRMTFSEVRLNDQIAPDAQIPDNNRTLNRDMWHWGRLWEWEQTQYELPLAEPTPSQKAMLDATKSRIGDILTATMSSTNYINGTIIPRALASFEKAAIRRADDGRIVGAPLLSNNECNRTKGEMRMDDVENMLYAFALDNYVNNNSKHDDKFFLVFDHAIDQGFAFGSGMGTNHHYGYNVRKIYDAAWLMREKIATRGKTEEYSRVLAYWSALAETRLPYIYGRDELLDSWHTLLIPKLVSALMLPTEAEQYRAMLSLGEWLSGSLGFTPGTIGGIKPDGTTFHHGGFYPAYSVGAFAMVGYYCQATVNTDFAPSEPARRSFKHALRTLGTYTNLRDWGLGISGRHPFGANTRIPDADVNAFGYLAALGDLTGNGKGVDPELAGDYLRLKGTDKQLNALFKKEGIAASAAPQGFYVYNYGATGIHRRDDWMVTLKAFNSDVWGSEIYAKDNRYGRYQSYGTVQIVGLGSPVGTKASGFSQEGWDWNHAPGATTIRLPFEELNSPLPGTLMERNPERFSGVSSLEGRNGAMAFHFVEGNRKNFTPGATAYKSVFCFDNRLVFLGSGIDNNNTMYPTETTLYQLRLDDRSEGIEVDGEMQSAFPFDVAKNGGRLMLSDTKGNYYVVKDAATLRIAKRTQTSPNDKTSAPQTGDFATAWIDHGKAPKQAGYEYAAYIRPSNKQIGRFAKKDTYEVLQRDNTAHVVRDLETGITGYVGFGEYRGPGLVRRIDAQTIVMERTDTDGQIVMSICTPDLGLTEKTYTTRQQTRPIAKTVVLGGEWEPAEQHPKLAVTHQNGETTLTVDCLDGQPVEFRLKKR